MVRAVVVAHGNLAHELVETARTVYGSFDGVEAVTNAGKSPDALAEEIEARLTGDAREPSLIFVDFFGGSCCHTCLQIEQRRGDVRVVTGVNLPMLVAFLYKRNEVPFDRLADEVIERGRGSMRIISTEDI